MARIRTIKPEFFTSEDIVCMTPLARLFYVSLWCEADREGRLEWKPITFKMRYLPGDQCDVNQLAQELVERGLIVLYSVDGKQYGEIPTFTEHQVINNRESPSTIPARDVTRASRVKHAKGTRVSGREGKEGREGKGTGTALLAGFVKFWDTWPANDRKQDKAKCAEKWADAGLEAIADQIIADVATKKNTEKWKAGFVEMPATYLNNRRWEDSEGGQTDWTESRSGVERRAGELGIGPWSETEQWPTYFRRVMEAHQKGLQ